MYIILSIDFKLLLDVKNGGILIFFIDTTQCDVTTQCDAQNESISKKRPLESFVFLRRTASQRRIASHLRKILYLNFFHYL